MDESAHSSDTPITCYSFALFEHMTDSILLSNTSVLKEIKKRVDVLKLDKLESTDQSNFQDSPEARIKCLLFTTKSLNPDTLCINVESEIILNHKFLGKDVILKHLIENELDALGKK